MSNGFHSLKKNTDFQFVYNNGKSFANRTLVMYICKNDKEFNRVGISISKKIGNSVVRHQIKRRIREIFRLKGYLFNSGLDIVIIARTGARNRNYHLIYKDIIHLSKLHGIFLEECE